jgi:hypothetical protein
MKNLIFINTLFLQSVLQNCKFVQNKDLRLNQLNKYKNYGKNS